MDSSTSVKYSRVPSVPRTLDAVLLACLRCLRILWLRQCRMELRPHLYCLPSRFPYREIPLLIFLGMCGIWSCVFPVAFVLIALTVPAQVLVVALRSVAEVATFSPNPRFFAPVLGISVLV